MAGGVGSFITGLEGMSFVEGLSDRLRVPPQRVVKIAGILLGLLVVIAFAAVVFQGGGSSGETLEIETGSSRAQLSTEFDEEPAPAPAETEAATAVPLVVVYVTGAVANPGLYSLTGNDRVGDAVQAAGGMTPEAAQAVVNFAQQLVDGMQIHIPRTDEVNSDTPAATAAGSLAGGVAGSGAVPDQSTDLGGASALVNINTADSAALQTLDGVGPATAQKIIDYRSAHGAFQSKEDLKNVSGIGEKKYAAIEAHITV
ncbi:MAG: helix-hairpin-helix domain-containing protein [Coriobacteriales bacterium]|jgi:competence protein ComEA|nr:helix-hairpin-helix domain-containing protein [Coriobacteriales bacterium]